MTPLAPTRPRLAEALACVVGDGIESVRAHLRGGYAPRWLGDSFGWWRDGQQASAFWSPRRITDVREAWEVLCTRLDLADAVEDPRRAFDGHCERVTDSLDGSYAYYTTPPRAYPPTVADAVALASDWAGVVTAEAIARELTGRDCVVWRVVPAADAAPRAPSYNHTRADGRYEPCPTCALRAAQHRAAQSAYGHDLSAAELAAAHRARDLLGTGYALDAVTDTAVVLVAPALDDGAPAGAEETRR